MRRCSWTSVAGHGCNCVAQRTEHISVVAEHCVGQPVVLSDADVEPRNVVLPNDDAPNFEAEILSAQNAVLDHRVSSGIDNDVTEQFDDRVELSGRRIRERWDLDHRPANYTPKPRAVDEQRSPASVVARHVIEEHGQRMNVVACCPYDRSAEPSPRVRVFAGPGKVERISVPFGRRDQAPAGPVGVVENRGTGREEKGFGRVSAPTFGDEHSKFGGEDGVSLLWTQGSVPGLTSWRALRTAC